MEKEKMTNAEVKTLMSFFDEISTRHSDLPIKIWYALSRNKVKLDDTHTLIEKGRLALVDKYGVKDDLTGYRTVPEDKMQIFSKEYSELLALETDVEVFKINLSDLEEMKKMQGVNGIYAFFKHYVWDKEEVKTEKS